MHRPMSRIVLFILAIFAASPALASASYGRWSASDLGAFSEAHTSNEFGATFGMLCSDECIFYVNTGQKCEQGRSYPAVMNTVAGAASIDLTCVVVESELPGDGRR